MPNSSRKVIVDGGSVIELFVVFVKKVLTKKEVELHVYVCEKVPQEIFHLKTPFGDSSVSLGTTSNSSLTNPLLGAPEDK